MLMETGRVKVLIVLAHPRRHSLTGAIADAFAAAVEARGHVVEWADLVAERFDPVLSEADEPDWNDAHKRYSPAVQSEMRRVERNEAAVLVFPVWWWSMPAILKGWIDRVWNFGWAYGDDKLPLRRVWMLALGGVSEAAYAKRNYSQAMRTQLEEGILRYCGVADARLEILYGSLEGKAECEAMLERARSLGASF